MSEEWGPWIELNDAQPSVGDFIQISGIGEITGRHYCDEGRVAFFDDHGRLMLDPIPMGCEHCCKSRWRRRKPRGLTILENILNEIKEPAASGQRGAPAPMQRHSAFGAGDQRNDAGLAVAPRPDRRARASMWCAPVAETPWRAGNRAFLPAVDNSPGASASGLLF